MQPPNNDVSKSCVQCVAAFAAFAPKRGGGRIHYKHLVLFVDAHCATQVTQQGGNLVNPVSLSLFFLVGHVSLCALDSVQRQNRRLPVVAAAAGDGRAQKPMRGME